MESSAEELVEDLESYIDKIDNIMFMQPDSKRSRDQLGSSDHEDLRISADPLRRRESMDATQKAGSIRELTDDVEDLKQAMDFNNSLIEVLKQDNTSLRVEVNTPKQLTTELQQKNHKISNDILDMQSRSMRDNIIIHWLPWNKQRDLPVHKATGGNSFMKDSLKMEERKVDAVHFSRVHLIRQAKASRQKSRPIAAKVIDTKMKKSIMGRGNELWGTNYSISDQHPPEILRRRRLLHPVMTEARSRSFFINKLNIYRKLYSNPEITYWLCVGDTNTSR